MHALPEALRPFAAYRQFFPCRIEPSKTRPGKTDKFALHRTGGYRVDHTDPAHWMSVEEAIAAQYALGADGIGFHIGADAPFWFLDIDSALTPAGWSPVAQQLCQIFTGAAMEVSSSGKGLHLFGTGTVPPHGTRLKEHGLEFYTSGRFVALTGIQATGNAAIDFSALMPSFVAQWFPPSAAAGNAAPTRADWTTEPVPEWRGSIDDDELIRRACRTNGLASLTGADFYDLWHDNADRLALSYPPDPGSPDAYGASEADSALATRLAFWTGKNCERIRAIMRRSALARDKWEREDYLMRTILNAVAICSDVCKDRREASASITIEPETMNDTNSYVSAQNIPVKFKGCIYVQDHNGIMLPTGDIIDQARFNARFGGLTLGFDSDGEKAARSPWDGFLNNKVTRMPRADSTTFRPDLPFQSGVEMQDRLYVNMYRPPHVSRRKGDVEPLRSHIRKLLPYGDDALIAESYFKFLVQHPGYKSRWAPFIQGCEGNGKGLLLEVLIRAIGDKYVFMIGPNMIENGFNAWAENHVLYVGDDIFRPNTREGMIDNLRRYITESRHPVTYKGIDSVNKVICGNWLFFDNHADLMRITDNTRRIAPLYCAQQYSHQLEASGLGLSYFNDYFIPWLHNGGFEIGAEWLHTDPIDPRYNPAGKCQRAPLTTSTALAVSDGKTMFENDLTEWTETGEPGFAGGFISVTMLKRRLGDKGMSAVRMRHTLGAMGYVILGRTTRKVHPDEAQAVIYGRVGSAPVDLATEYETAQLRSTL